MQKVNSSKMFEGIDQYTNYPYEYLRCNKSIAKSQSTGMFHTWGCLFVPADVFWKSPEDSVDLDHIGKSKMSILSQNKDQKSLETRVFDCHLSPYWRQMAIKNTVSSDFLSAFVNC